MCVCALSRSVVPRCDLMYCSLLRSSVLGTPQARILEGVAIPFSRAVFPIQGLKLGLLYCRQILYCLSHQKAPREYIIKYKIKNHISKIRLKLIL